MNKKANCKDCVACVPNEEAASKAEFEFPDDYECLMMEETFPDCAHICTAFIYSTDWIGGC